MYSKDELYVVDLDTILYKILNRPGINNSKVTFKTISALFIKAVNVIKKRYKNVLFVGYSDVFIDGTPQYIDFKPDVKYFINIPLYTLIEQYRDRASRHVLSTKRPITVMSDEDIKKCAKLDKKIYIGYMFLPQSKIIRDIILRLK
jgi:hypothetical protein